MISVSSPDVRPTLSAKSVWYIPMPTIRIM